MTTEHEASEAPADAKMAAFETLWANVEARWDDEKAHAAALEFAARSGLLPELGGRYRKIRESDPARADYAKKRIDALFGAAMALLQESKLPRVEKPTKSANLLVGAVCLLLLGLLFWGLFGRHGSH
jgi:hypothetical protein